MIALLTDFGLQDPFVGVMKGVIAGLAPKASVVDLCHGVPPQDVRTAALFLRQSVPYFPKGTIFVCVVDPGVGSSRRIVAARNSRHVFLAPDNGLLSWIGGDSFTTVSGHGREGLKFHSLEDARLFLPHVSATFHGRDVFAPVAARLATGLKPEALGPAVKDPVLLPWPEGEILAFDRFGNAITSVGGKPRAVKYKGKALPVRKTYADVREGEELAYVGSSGLIELSVRNGNFAAKRGAKRGDRVQAAG